MFVTYPKSGKSGKPKGLKHETKGIHGASGKEAITDFYGMQGTLALDEEAERMDLYAKVGTGAKERQSEVYETSMPRSRFRSQFP